jgi:2-polyprenyl-6-methoxyphenol hydroxylase-like FAD-dependent oxidoreductase
LDEGIWEMSRIVVLGGSLIGLATALMITEQGHEVTVLERDPEPPPATADEAIDGWERPGVMQFQLVSFLLPRGRQLLDEHLPEVSARLAREGGTEYNGLGNMPPSVTDRSGRPGDERFATLAARRPLLEYAMATVADGAVDVRRGVHVTGLLSDGHRRVTGVRLRDAGQRDGELAADLVIDAMGRRSPLPAWLAAIGVTVPAEDSEDLGFVYYGRYFQSPAPARLTGGLFHYDCYSVLILPSDRATWSATLVTNSRDHALRPLREEANFTKLVGACPVNAPILELEPIGDMFAAAGIADRRRQLVDGGAPVVTGVLTVGDAAACTNPTLGRGMTIGLMHAAVTAEAVAEHVADPVALALEHDRLTTERILPWYRATTQLDRQRAAQVAAAIESRPPSPPPPGNPVAELMRNISVAMRTDPDMYRAFIETVYMLALPQDLLARPGFAERASELAGGQAPTLPPGPSRAELLAMLS